MVAELKATPRSAATVQSEYVALRSAAVLPVTYRYGAAVAEGSAIAEGLSAAMMPLPPGETAPPNVSTLPDAQIAETPARAVAP